MALFPHGTSPANHVSPHTLAAAAYLIAQGATRTEAETAIARIYTKAVPATLEAILDILDSELLALRAENR